MAGIYYSVPFDLIGEKVDIRFSSTKVEIFHKNQRVALHARSKCKKGSYVTESSHMPPNHQDMHETWDSDRLISWAKSVGPSVAKVIEEMFKAREFEQQALKGCMAVMNLTKKYSNELMEAACSHILENHITPCFKSVNNVLEKKISENSAQDDQSRTENGARSNPDSITRGSEYYGGNQ